MLHYAMQSQKNMHSHISTYTSFMIYKTIYYARGFLQIQNENEQTPKEIRAAITTALQEKLTPLPQDPSEIPEHIKAILPFTLPITQRSYTRATVNGLRKIFKFDKLTNNYFAKLPTLPERYQDLSPELQTYFPISNRQSLQYLSYFRRKLADYYTFTAIPNSYFQLPPPKKPLPTTYQELNYKVRGLFPFNSSTSKVPLAEAVAQLREYYIFKLLPSDYFITKPSLPTNIELICTDSLFTYPITDDTIAKTFLNEISQRYQVQFPLPDHIMQANPTDKPVLPTDSQELAKLNITLPITTPQQLTQIAKTLREHFYFKQLPTSWINITNPLAQDTNQEDNTDTNKTNLTKQPLPPIPDNIDDINSALLLNNIQLTLPITLQSQITLFIQTFKQLYTIRTIPNSLLKLPPLPTPTWEIFTPSTTLPNKPPTINTVAIDIS